MQFLSHRAHGDLAQRFHQEEVKHELAHVPGDFEDRFHAVMAD